MFRETRPTTPPGGRPATTPRVSERKSHASRKRYVFCFHKRASQSRKQLSRQFCCHEKSMFRQPPVRRRFPVPVEALMPVEMQENGLGSAPPRSNRKIASLRSPRPAGAKKQPCDVNQVVGSRVFTGGGSIEHGPKPFLRPPARFPKRRTSCLQPQPLAGLWGSRTRVFLPVQHPPPPSTRICGFRGVWAALEPATGFGPDSCSFRP